MTLVRTFAIFLVTASAWIQIAIAGPVTPDCTAEKAAKHAAEKATVGVSANRCAPGKTAKNSAKDAVGIDHKGRIKSDADKSPAPAEKIKDAAQR